MFEFNFIQFVNLLATLSIFVTFLYTMKTKIAVLEKEITFLQTQLNAHFVKLKEDISTMQARQQEVCNLKHDK